MAWCLANELQILLLFGYPWSWKMRERALLRMCHRGWFGVNL